MVTATLDRRLTRPLCARGLHDDVPENVYQEPRSKIRRCQPCRLKYNRERRRGVRWVASDRNQPTEADGPLTPAQVTALRATVTCLGCGVPPERLANGKVRTFHKTGCRVAPIPEG